MRDRRGDCGDALTVEELARALRAVDPAAHVVPGRLVRRAIRRARGLAPSGRRLPHRHGWALSGAEALDVFGPGPLGLSHGGEIPPVVLLIARPDRHVLARLDRQAALTWAWRRLFHSRLDATFFQLRAQGRLELGWVHERIGQIGPDAFEEARAVLRQEGFLLDPDDDRATYAEFATVFLELWHFAPEAIAAHFPALDDPSRVFQVVTADLDPRGLLWLARPSGAIEPAPREPDPESLADDEGCPDETAIPPQVDGRRFRALMGRAAEADAWGNDVRAAILKTAAATLAGPRRAAAALAGARADLDQLCERLRPTLGLDDEAVLAWRDALPALLARSARGGWTAEARLLYDLQAACVDFERGVSVPDLLGWLLSMGRRPLSRPLPGQSTVLVGRNLRRASRRLTTVRLAPEALGRLAPLMRSAVHTAEARIRSRFGPPLAAALGEIGLIPTNLPERVAFDKLVAELLDRVVQRDYFAMGDLRDALSRNNLKLPDLAGPVELVRGDRLLRADGRLASMLEGVYRRGEIYLRMLQRFSSLAFGTGVGRILTRNVVLPFGGAFVLLEGIKHLLGFVRLHLELVSTTSVLVTGLILLGLTHSSNLRQTAVAGIRGAFRAARWLLWDLPSWVLRRRPIAWLLANRTFAACWRWMSRPLLLASALGVALRWAGLDPIPAALTGMGLFALLIPLWNSRTGREVEEAVGDALMRSWHRLLSDLIPGLFRLVLDVFARIVEAIDRALYAVDEWLRFRAGQGGGSLWVKAILSPIWWAVAYVVRIVVNLLIEPQANPVKHFPVVTVSHKVILPVMIALRENVLKRLFPYSATAVFTAMQFLLPGFFGFLVWELKENWRLYEANRPKTLRPVVVGGHGETITRLLRPGFHSGTIPKLFARLRHSDRAALKVGRRRTGLKQESALDHVEEEIRHFLERDVLALLLATSRPGDPALEVGRITLATSRIQIELHPEGLADDPLRIAFVERRGQLLAEVSPPTWIDALDPEQRFPLDAALIGLYRMAGVEAVRDLSRDLPAEPVDPLPWSAWVETWEAGRPGAGVPASASAAAATAVPSANGKTTRESAVHAP